MKYHNVVYHLSNYATNDLQKTLTEFGQKGYKLVGTEMANNKYGCTIMYLFFAKELGEEGADNA